MIQRAQFRGEVERAVVARRVGQARKAARRERSGSYVPRPLEFTSRITASASLQFVNMAVMLVWLPGRRRVSPSLRRLSPERRAGIYSSTPSTDNGTAKPETVHFQRPTNKSNDSANGRLSIFSAPSVILAVYPGYRSEERAPAGTNLVQLPLAIYSEHGGAAGTHTELHRVARDALPVSRMPRLSPIDMFSVGHRRQGVALCRSALRA
jgi:hypothetical protein